MNTKTFIAYISFPIIVLLISIVLFIKTCYIQEEISNLNIQVNESIAGFNKTVSSFVSSKELKEFAESLNINFSEIKKDLDKLNGKILAVGTSVVNLAASLNNSSSDSVVDHEIPIQPEKCSFCDTFAYTTQIQAKNIFFKDLPFAIVYFDASKKDPWNLKTDNLELKIDTVLGERSDKHFVFYHKVSLENKSRPELANKKFDLEVVKSTWLQVTPQENTFRFWNPHLDLGIVGATSPYNFADGLLGAELGFSFISYGKYENDNVLRFLRFGLGFRFNEYVGLFGSITPITLNLGSFIPFITDLWLHPIVLFEKNGLYIGAGFSTTL